MTLNFLFYCLNGFSMDMTVVIACKDRQTNIAYCAASIAGCNPKPNTIIVDFGSKVPISSFVCYSNINIIRIDRDTKLFHKARALNIGIKEVKTKFICVTDADQIFQSNFFNVVYGHLCQDSNSFLMCRTHFLKAIPSYFTPKEVHKHFAHMITLCKRDRINFCGDGNCNATLTQWFNQVQGYDENYIGFAAEDSDLVFRAMQSGLNRIWLDDKTNMIHLPHIHTGVYYDKKYIAANKARFNQRITQEKLSLVVNPPGEWGLK